MVIKISTVSWIFSVEAPRNTIWGTKNYTSRLVWEGEVIHGSFLFLDAVWPCSISEFYGDLPTHFKKKDVNHNNFPVIQKSFPKNKKVFKLGDNALTHSIKIENSMEPNKRLPVLSMRNKSDLEKKYLDWSHSPIQRQGFLKNPRNYEWIRK